MGSAASRPVGSWEATCACWRSHILLLMAPPFVFRCPAQELVMPEKKVYVPPSVFVQLVAAGGRAARPCAVLCCAVQPAAPPC